MSLASTQTQTALSGGKRTNHEATDTTHLYSQSFLFFSLRI